MMIKTYNYFVYILECADQSYYTGVTNNLENRLRQHNSGENKTETDKLVANALYFESLNNKYLLQILFH